MFFRLKTLFRCTANTTRCCANCSTRAGVSEDSPQGGTAGCAN